jgi:hypothetical protein
MFKELTPHEAGRLESALCNALMDADEVGQFDEPLWDETADVICDLRAQHEYMPPETNGFRLDQA